MIENYVESALMAGLLGFFIGLAGIAAIDDPPAAATQVAIITLIYGYTIKFVCNVLAKKYGDWGIKNEDSFQNACGLR